MRLCGGALWIRFLLLLTVEAEPFVSTWIVKIPGETITLPFTSVPSPSVIIFWPDEQTEVLTSLPVSHFFPSPGTYNITITGNITGFRFGSGGDAEKLIGIVSWGDGFWMDETSVNAFSGCVNLAISANDQPKFLSNATLEGMFRNSSVNSVLNWDLMNNVVSTKSMFESATKFNQPIYFGGLGALKSTNSMFKNAAAFNRPLNFSNTPQLVDTASMFYGAKAFNQPVTLKTDNVVSMQSMFYEATNFNQNLSMKLNSANNLDSMFYSAENFNQPVDSLFHDFQGGSVSFMFAFALAFNQPVVFAASTNTNADAMFQSAVAFNSAVNISSQGLNSTKGMFRDAILFNQKLFLDTRSVSFMDYMFSGARSFNQSVNFNTSQVQSMTGMFSSARSFNQNVAFSPSPLLSTVNGMFQNAVSFNQTVTMETAGVQRMDFMFYNASSFNQDVTTFNTMNVMNMTGMFQGASSFNQQLVFNTSKVVHFRSMFQDARSFNQQVNFAVSPLATSTQAMFQGALTFNQRVTIDTSNVLDMSAMFLGAKSFNTSVNFTTGKVTNMDSMFESALSFNQPIVFNGASLIQANSMFRAARMFNSAVTITSSLSLTSVHGMFQGATNFNRNITLQTDNVTDMGWMFESAISYNQPVNFATRNVTKMDFMFRNATAFDQEVPFDTRNVADFTSMFQDAASFNRTVNFSTPSANSFSAMFMNTSRFNSPLTLRTTAALSDCTDMFRYATVFNQPIDFLGGGGAVFLDGMFAFAVNFNQPISPLNASNVMRTTSMFEGAAKFNQAVSWQTESAISMDKMFRGAVTFNRHVSLITDGVTTMSEMFAGASSFAQIVNFSSTTKLQDMGGMFSGAPNFNQDLSALEVHSVENCSDFCETCALPNFTSCVPCSTRIVKTASQKRVCNCPQGDSCGVPSDGRTNITTNWNGTTINVTIPPDPIFANGTVQVEVSGPNGTISNVISIVLIGAGGGVLEVNNLSTPIILSFALEISLDTILNAVKKCVGTSFVEAPLLPQCGYFNDTTHKWETNGCTVSAINTTYVQCSCTHLTDFAILAPDHNNLVPTEILDLTPENIAAHSTGLVTVVIILGIFLVVFALAWQKDRVEAADYERLRLSKQEKWSNFEAEHKKTTLLKEIKIAFQKRHTWFSLLFRKSGTSFRSVDRTFVALLSAFSSMSMSAHYHARDNDSLARVVIIVLSVCACWLPSQFLTQLFIRTGEAGFFEQWEQSHKPANRELPEWAARCLSFRFPDPWRYVWRTATVGAVATMVVFVLTLSMQFDRQPFFFCQGEPAVAWVTTWLSAYAITVFAIEPTRLLFLALVAHYFAPKRVAASKSEEVFMTMPPAATS